MSSASSDLTDPPSRLGGTVRVQAVRVIGASPLPPRVLASGPLADTITTEVLSDAFDLPLRVDAHDGRYAARLGTV